MNTSTRWSRWTTAAMVAGALLVGTAIGPVAVQAATAGLVRLEGGGSSHLAKVSSTGQLSVNPGLTQTPAHQILAAEASPSSYVTAAVLPNCAAGKTYKIPPGHAFILTGVEYDLIAATGSSYQGLLLSYGPSATPCTTEVTFAVSDVPEASDNQLFQPGIAIPAGNVIGLDSQNGDGGGAEIYGYLVPAAEVPQHPASAGSGRPSILPLHLPRH